MGASIIIIIIIILILIILHIITCNYGSSSYYYYTNGVRVLCCRKLDGLTWLRHRQLRRGLPAGPLLLYLLLL